MKKIFAFYFISLMLISCGSQKITQSYWHNQKYENSIAGKLKYDSQSGFMYAISNDEENLFVDLRISDKMLQRKIFSMGMTVWIDTLGKKQESLGITFPIGMRAAFAGRRPEMGQQPQQTEQRTASPNRQDFRNRMAETTQKIKLTGFDGFDEINNTNKVIPGVISGKIERDAMDILQYTLVIPFDRIPKIKNKNFTLGIKTGTMDMADMAAMRERMMAQGGRRPQNGGGSGGFEGRRPSGGFSPENMETMTTSSEMWIKNIQISKNSNQ